MLLNLNTLFVLVIAGELSLLASAAFVTMIKSMNNETGTSVNEGGKLVLACFTDRDVGGTVEWRHNHTAINVTDTRYHAVVISDGSQLRHSLTVSHMRQEDAGLFQCRLIFTDRIIVNVVVMKVLELMPSMTVTASHNLTLDCEGVVSSVISWYHDGHRLTVNADTVIQVKNDVDDNRQRSLLTRLNVNESASGDYMCKDESEKLESSRTVKVKVQPKPRSAASNSRESVFIIVAIFSQLLLDMNMHA